MPTLTNALQVGLSGLRANQAALNVTGQNIANVSTEGYTRQQIILETERPLSTTIGIFGTGVKVGQIRRYRESFVDAQLREQNQTLGDLEKQTEALTLLEGVINEPSETGLHNSIKNFFNSLQDLANNPESSSVRTVVREQARGMTQMFNLIDQKLEEVRDNKNFEIIDRVSQVNDILDQIASLNVEIARTEVLGRGANDLRDKRDLLADKLSKFVDLKINEDPANGSYTVSIGGRAFVVVDKVIHLEAKSVNVEGKEEIRVINPMDRSEVNITSGELHGILETRDQIIPGIRDQIDQLATAIIEEVNQIHSQGYGLQGSKAFAPTSIEFFMGTDAKTMSLSFEIESDPSNIAASSNGKPGDNANALAMAQLRSAQVMNNQSFTFEDYLGGIVSTLGLESSTIQDRLQNQELLVEHLQNYRESMNGVSLDEELTGLIRFQQAFGANARIITTTKELMDIVVMLGQY